MVVAVPAAARGRRRRVPPGGGRRDRCARADVRLDRGPRDHRRRVLPQLAARASPGGVRRRRASGRRRVHAGDGDRDRRRESGSSRCTRGFEPIPELLDDELWRIFEVEVGAELAYAQAWSYKDGNDPTKGYEQHGNRWTYALVQVAADDQRHRALLLDASLDALARDFRPSTLGWYAAVHEALEPTREERELRLERYLALLAVPAPAAMKAGLAGLRARRRRSARRGRSRRSRRERSRRSRRTSPSRRSRFWPMRLCGNRTPVLLCSMPLRRRSVTSGPTSRSGRSPCSRPRPADAPRATLLGLVDAVSPTLRERVAALVGVQTTSFVAEPVASVGELLGRLDRIPRALARRRAGCRRGRHRGSVAEPGPAAGRLVRAVRRLYPWSPSPS